MAARCVPSAGTARASRRARSRKIAKPAGVSSPLGGFGLMITAGSGGPLADFGLAAGAAGTAGTPSALSFSVTELLMASTIESNCSCVMPCGSATGAWACTATEPAESKSIAKMMKENANMADGTRWGATGAIIDLILLTDPPGSVPGRRPLALASPRIASITCAVSTYAPPLTMPFSAPSAGLDVSLATLTTFRAAGRELGRCDVERRTPSTTAGRDDQEHRRPDAGDACYAGAGAGARQKTPLISLQSSIPQDTNSVSRP
jgi:hypothetical protein